MDVIFDLQGGKSFSIEVGFFDTIKEIKEKVQKYHQEIPVSKQTLILKGQILKDDENVQTVEILHNTHIQLLISLDSENNNSNSNSANVKTEEISPSTTKIHVNVKTPSKTHVPLEVDINDTVLKLKERIHDVESVPVNKLILHVTGTELHDHKLLRDCDISDNCEIDASLKPTPTAASPPAAAAGGGGSNNNNNNSNNKKLKLMVLPKSGTKKIPVEVNASDNVGELRKELQKLHQRVQFHLPQEGYFFIYKQNVMDDDRSFRWHHVAQGDTIEIFNGSVTGGS